MSTINEKMLKFREQQKFSTRGRSTSTPYDTEAAKQRQKKQEEEEKRRKKLLDYLNTAKKSAIKRGMYNQKPYQKTVSEAGNNV